MKRPNCALVVVLALAGAAACAGSRENVTVEVDRSKGVIRYPVIAHPQAGGDDCTVVEWTRERTHLKRGWTVEFQMRNNCASSNEMGIVDKDSLFDGSSPHVVTVPAHDMRVLTLTVTSGARVGPHKSDITFRGKNYDPDWEVDP